MIYNVVLVTGVEKSGSVIHVHVSILFQIIFSFRLLQNTEHIRKKNLIKKNKGFGII